MTQENNESKSSHCPHCGLTVEVPGCAAGGDDARNAAFLQNEGNTCRALAEAVARLKQHEVELTGMARGIGGYGTPSEHTERYFEDARRQAEEMQEEIASLRAYLHHGTEP